MLALILLLSQLRAQDADQSKVGSIRVYTPSAAASPPSVEVHRDRTVTFRLFAPRAQTVDLVGRWERPGRVSIETLTAMVRGSNDIWHITIGPLQPDIYAYSFIADGLEMVDRYNPWVQGASSGYGPRPSPLILRSVVEVPGDPPQLWENQVVPHGTVHYHRYFSKSLDVARRLHVYTPPGYENGSKQYPVLYLLNAGGDDANSTSFGQIHLIADNLLAQRKAKPMIIVMPNIYMFLDLSTQALQSIRSRGMNPFLEDFRKEVMPLVEKTYRVKANRDNRAIFGGSFGASHAVRFGLSHRELFAWVGASAGGFLQESEIDGTFPGAKSNLRLLWFSCGVEDPQIENARKCSAALRAKGISHQFFEAPGGHPFENTRPTFATFLALLFVK